MTITTEVLVSEAVSAIPATESVIRVSLSNELVVLLSDQLYQSPVKAIEELVINSYDAGAKNCKVYVPETVNADSFIVIYDDGIGMDANGLTNLWQVGRSNKREGEAERVTKRKQIGRFGIGKLATYTIANALTYITKNKGQILSVSIDFTQFTSGVDGTTPINMPVKKIEDWSEFSDSIAHILTAASIDIDDSRESWTIAVMENLKEHKARKITPALLQWILSTAMPLEIDFKLQLNGKDIVSSKEDYTRLVEFNLSDLPEKRLESLKKATGEDWSISTDKLISSSFPNGVSGSVMVTDRTLIGNKSDDILRSHGFFIRVRGRLVNTTDPLFVDKALVHGVFNRFSANISADDLDSELKASREAFEESSLKDKLKELLREVFNESVSRYETKLKELASKDKKTEGGREIIAPQLVERPIADAISEHVADSKGADANEEWFYIDMKTSVNLKDTARKLYTEERIKYKYEYSKSGSTSRLVKFDPDTATFWINENHELAMEYSEGNAKTFLEDFATAEALLEVYMREAQIPAHTTGQILERRDLLLRNLVKDHAYSLSNISDSLRKSLADERELEILLVVAARGLGFVANHVSNAGEPDGIARFMDYPQGERKITLEAKSSEKVPSLSAIDFAGLHEHMYNEGAQGCLLVAPDYPGNTKDDSAAATRAQQLKISCWTVELLARFIEAVEPRHLNATHLLDIVLNYFAPKDVEAAVNKLLSTDTADYPSLYQGILSALENLQSKLSDKIRNIDMVATVLSMNPEFSNISVEDVKKAVLNLSNASQGGMLLRDDNIHLHVGLDELRRRLAGLTKTPGDSRRMSNFRTQ